MCLEKKLREEAASYVANLSQLDADNEDSEKNSKKRKQLTEEEKSKQKWVVGVCFCQCDLIALQSWSKSRTCQEHTTAQESVRDET